MSSKSSASSVVGENAFWAFLSLLGLYPTLPIFLKLPPYLAWDITDNHGLPRQGQYTGQSTVLSLSEIFWWKVWWSQDFVVTLQTILDVL